MAALSLKQFYHKYGTGVPNSFEQCEQIWKAATKYADENCHSLQQLKQLKAKIAALVQKYDAADYATDDAYEMLLDDLRQLSAV